MAFRVWSCEEFENGSFMRADYSIKCSMDNPEYASIVALCSAFCSTLSASRCFTLCSSTRPTRVSLHQSQLLSAR